MWGKQPAPAAYQTQKTRRIVKSHKASIQGAAWTDHEIQVLQQARDWRDKQRLEKIIVHNRSADTEKNHKLPLNEHSDIHTCEKCPKTSKNLSKFLKDTCGGAADYERALPGGRRVSVILTQREQIVREHNLSRTTQHHLAIPTDPDELPTCSLCQCSKLGKDGSGSEDFSVRLAAIPNESENQLSKCQF